MKILRKNFFFNLAKTKIRNKKFFHYLKKKFNLDNFGVDEKKDEMKIFLIKKIEISLFYFIFFLIF